MNTAAAAAVAPSRLGVAAALAAVFVVWGSTYFAIRVGLEGFPPFLMGAFRFFAAGVLMYAVLRWRGVAAPTRGQWGRLFLLSIFMVVLSNGLVNFAEQDVSSGLAAVAVASMPLWAGLFAAMRGTQPSRAEWIGLVIGFVGVVWLNAGSSLTGSPRGMIALLCAPIAWAWGSIWSRDLDLPSPFMSAAGQMICGTFWMLVAAGLMGERMTAMPSAHALMAVVYLALFGSIVAFTAYVWLLQNVRPALATSYAYVNPPIAVLLGAGLLGERFGWHDIGPMLVILAGVVVITLAKSR